MDQTELLSTATLKLAPDLKSGPAEGDRMVVKNEPAKSYLVVEKTNWRLLARFREGETVANLLPKLIIDRACPALGDFYELILKAHRNHILTRPDDIVPRVRAAEWNHRITWDGVRMIGMGTFVIGYGILLFWDIALPETIWEFLVAFLLTAFSLTAGQFLAACVLHDNDCEVYPPRVNWKTLVPHLRFDLDDAIMGGRRCEVAAGLMAMAPLFLLTGLCILFYAGIGMLLVLAVLWQMFPGGSTPAARIMRAHYRGLRPSITHDFLFEPNRRPSMRLRLIFKGLDKTYIGIRLVSVFGWLLILYYVYSKLFGMDLFENFASLYVEYKEGFSGVLKGTGIALAAVGLCGGGYLGVRHALSVAKGDGTAGGRQKKKSPRKVSDESITHEAVVELLRETLLFGELRPEHIEAIAQRLGAISLKAKNYAFAEGDPADKFYIVFAGKVEVLQQLKSGRPARVATLQEGDVFGEVALLRDGPRTRSVRTMKPTILLTLDKDDFQELVVDPLGRDQIEEIVQRRAFLHRIALCKDWSSETIKRFSQISVLNTYQPEEVMIHDKRANSFFSIVYDGTVEVRKAGRRLARLRSGDFVGEISLLQNSYSNADVVAVESARTLTVNKNQFLRFLGEDFGMALYFERIASQRLKHPIFPLSGKSFDVMESMG